MGQEDPLEEGMATYSSILAWRIPWTGEPIVLQSVGLQSVGHDLGTKQQQHRSFRAEPNTCAHYFYHINPHNHLMSPLC